MAQAASATYSSVDAQSPYPFALWRRPGPGTWVRKALSLLLLLPAALWLGYVVIVNIMLSTNLVAWLASYNPVNVTMHYGSAWSLWPGVVHMKDFRLSGSDSVLQWAVELDEGITDIHLLELPKKKFHASSTHAKGFVFRLRLLVDPTSDRDLDAFHIKALPSIPEFTSPPLKPELPPAKDLEHSDVGYNLWTVQLEDIDTTIKEIWIQQVRYAGEGRVRGQFFFKPIRAVQVGPTEIQLRSGEVHLGPDVVARVDADAEVALDAFDPRTVEGLNIFEILSAHVRLAAQLPGLHADDLQRGSGVEMRLNDGSGELQADLKVTKGRVEPGSVLSYATSRLDIATDDLVASVEGEVGLKVYGDGRARGAVNLLRAKLDRPGRKLPSVAVEKVEAIVDAPELWLTRLPRKGAAKVEMGAATIPDLRWLNPDGAAPGAPGFTGGAAFMSGRLALDEEGRGTGALRAQMKQGAMQWKGWRVKVDASADLALEGVDPSVKRAKIRKSHVKIDNLETEHQGAAWPRWWARVELDEGKVAPGLLEAAVRLDCKDAQPAVALLDAEDVIPGWASGLLTMDGLKASATVKRKGDTLDLRLLRAEGGSLAIRGGVKKSGDHKPRGAFLVQSGVLSVGIKIAEDGAGVHLLAGDGWLREQMSTLDR